MIDRLVLCLLARGMRAVRCDPFDGVRSRRGRGYGGRQGGAIRRGEPNNAVCRTRDLEELVATLLARPLFSSTRRPPQDAASGAAGSSDLTDAQADRDRYDAGPSPRNLRGQRRQAAEGRRRRRRKRLADREHHAPRSLVERSGRNQDLAAKARSKFSRRRLGHRRPVNPAGDCLPRRLPVRPRVQCRAAGPAVAPASRSPCSVPPARYRRQRAAPAAVMSAPRRWHSAARRSPSRSSCWPNVAPAPPDLEPLEQPSSLQAAEPRVSGAIPTDRSRQRPFVASGAAGGARGPTAGSGRERH